MQVSSICVTFLLPPGIKELKHAGNRKKIESRKVKNRDDLTFVGLINTSLSYSLLLLFIRCFQQVNFQKEIIT